MIKFPELEESSDDEDDPATKALLADLSAKTFVDKYGVEKA